MIRRLGLRARCYALRVATVDRLERERNAAVRERDLVRAANERMTDRAARAEGLVADRQAIAVAAQIGALLQALGHTVHGDLERDVDRAIDVERERRGQDHVAMARALGLADPARFAFELDWLLSYARQARDGHERYEDQRAILQRGGVVTGQSSAGEAEDALAELVRAAGARPSETL